ncbi:UNKNOWN [Stylonychia lemnae]|uniref:Uncharacterized protein n=1 Tax=Stylonychia lemnae TaxID=5949 RepID=A0A077ZZY3_STYLE|nr:UNKNOWN [Stylonychia lemnae]|eukprot:CDW75182.1 UNKNOWN [Stylonychia lemnae]
MSAARYSVRQSEMQYQFDTLYNTLYISKSNFNLQALFLFQDIDLKRVLFDKALDLSFQSTKYLMSFISVYQNHNYKIVQELAILCHLNYRYFTILHGNLDPYSFQQKFTRQEIQDALDKSIEYNNDILRNQSIFLNERKTIQILWLRILNQVGVYLQKVKDPKDVIIHYQNTQRLATIIDSQCQVKESIQLIQTAEEDVKFRDKIDKEQQANNFRNRIAEESNDEVMKEKEVLFITDQIKQTPKSLYEYAKSLIIKRQWDQIDIIRDCLQLIVQGDYDNFIDKQQYETEAYYILTSLSMFEAHIQGETSDIKSRFLDPLKDISELYYMPKDSLTLVFLVQNLAKQSSESQVILKFLKQWTSYLNKNRQPHKFKVVKIFLEMIFDINLRESILKGDYFEQLFEIFQERSQDSAFFRSMLSYLDFNDELNYKLIDGLMVIIETMEIKLKYLVDEQIPDSLITEQKNIVIINQSKISQAILDNVSKAKGKKFRKHLIKLCSLLLDQIKAKNTQLNLKLTMKIMILRSQIKQLLKIISNSKTSKILYDILIYDKETLYMNYHIVSFALENSKMLAAKYILQQFKKKSEVDLINYLNRMNMNQISRSIKGIFKDKFYCCLCHIAFRRSTEDPQWQKVEDEARNQIEKLDICNKSTDQIKLEAVQYMQQIISEEI